MIQSNLDHALNQGQAYVLFYVRIDSDFNKPTPIKNFISQTTPNGIKLSNISSPELAIRQQKLNLLNSPSKAMVSTTTTTPVITPTNTPAVTVANTPVITSPNTTVSVSANALTNISVKAPANISIKPLATTSANTSANTMSTSKLIIRKPIQSNDVKSIASDSGKQSEKPDQKSNHLDSNGKAKCLVPYASDSSDEDSPKQTNHNHNHLNGSRNFDVKDIKDDDSKEELSANKSKHKKKKKKKKRKHKKRDRSPSESDDQLQWVERTKETVERERNDKTFTHSDKSDIVKELMNNGIRNFGDKGM